MRTQAPAGIVTQPRGLSGSERGAVLLAALTVVTASQPVSRAPGPPEPLFYSACEWTRGSFSFQQQPEEEDAELDRMGKEGRRGGAGSPFAGCMASVC